MYKKLNLWLSVIIFEVLGLLSGIFAINARLYYTQGWIFGPVWTILYAVMGLGHYIIWTKLKGNERKKILILFYLQFFLNFIWSWFFFTLKSNLLATIDILLLLSTLYVLQYMYFKYKKTLFYMFIPYTLWVSFATILTIAVLILNRWWLKFFILYGIMCTR